MLYLSTRGHADRKHFCEILLEGLAPDGGLYLPEHYPQVDAATLAKWRPLPYHELAFEILSLYIDDIPAADLRAICRKTYTEEVFGSREIVPLKPLDGAVGAAPFDGPGSAVTDRGQGAASRSSAPTQAPLYLLALSNGPTLAFKDMAMQLLGNLFEYELSRRGEELNILGATSGDTGSAAEYAMRGKQGVRVFMTSPRGRMSPFQQAQMFSLQDENIHNLALDGVFDDCQDIVKAVSSDAAFKRNYRIGTVNSINWARLVAQVVYYFAGYFQATNVAPTLASGDAALPPEGVLSPRGGPSANVAPTHASSDAALPPEGVLSPRGGPSANVAPTQASSDAALPKVSFSVPSGNFGNICAGHVARMMGLPIERLVLATNENDVLDEFFRTGVYRVRSSADTHETSSPSMDISKASNFERFVFDLLGRDGERVRSLFAEQLAQGGRFDLGAEPAFHRIRERFGFASGTSSHADRLATIRDTFERFALVIDPHTADGLKVGREQRQSGVPMIVLETALPIKFAATIVEALGREPDRPPRFEGLEQLPRRVTVLAPDAETVKRFIASHCG